MTKLTFSLEDMETIFEKSGIGDKDTARVIWEEAGRLALERREIEERMAMQAQSSKWPSDMIEGVKSRALVRAVESAGERLSQRKFKRADMPRDAINLQALQAIVPGAAFSGAMNPQPFAPLEIVAYNAGDGGMRILEPFDNAQNADKTFDEMADLAARRGRDAPVRYTATTPEEAAEMFFAERAEPRRMSDQLAERGWLKDVTTQLDGMNRARRRLMQDTAKSGVKL